MKSLELKAVKQSDALKYTHGVLHLDRGLLGPNVENGK